MDNNPLLLRANEALQLSLEFQLLPGVTLTEELQFSAAIQYTGTGKQNKYLTPVLLVTPIYLYTVEILYSPAQHVIFD